MYSFLLIVYGAAPESPWIMSLANKHKIKKYERMKTHDDGIIQPHTQYTRRRAHKLGQNLWIKLEIVCTFNDRMTLHDFIHSRFFSCVQCTMELVVSFQLFTLLLSPVMSIISALTLQATILIDFNAMRATFFQNHSHEYE